jgi:hypothetical protein
VGARTWRSNCVGAAMNASAPKSRADPLGQVASHAALKISDRSEPLKIRLRLFWAYAKAARDLGASDVVEAEFLELARITSLAADLVRHADEDIRHVLHWAALGVNPFEEPR